MSMIQKIGLWFIERRIKKQMANIIEKVAGYKTYITLGFGAISATVAYLVGGFDVMGQTIPAPESLGALLNIWWVALSGMFLRAGVNKSGPIA